MPALPLDDAGPYVAAAYLVFLALLLTYVSIMATKLGRIEREIGELSELAERRAAELAAAAAVLGLAGALVVLRPLIGEDPIAVIMVTIGLAAILKAGVQMFYGTTPREMPKVLPTGSVDIAGAPVPLDRLAAVGVAAIALTAFSAFFRWSRHGIAMRAVADDQQAALVQGISVRRIFALAWALAAVSALLGGVLLADIAEVSQNLANFGLIVFPVVILGGLDSVAGTIVGGAVIGLLSQYAEGLSPGASQVVPYVALVLILLVRPYGLFGQVRIERV